MSLCTSWPVYQAIRAFLAGCAVGTCKMGPATDPDAVVDHNGCVHGFGNLLVADASVMPTIPGANTHLPVLAVAERMAEIIRRR